jgi:hypothetical protein
MVPISLLNFISLNLSVVQLISGGKHCNANAFVRIVREKINELKVSIMKASGVLLVFYTVVIFGPL